ncbi:hypothetical protein [Cereibacter sphaeroides]|uniref:hypothetical protein n=1 Tax=Cereibacter sphaeroides TaxID=1063 RepID=UPI001F35DE3C|nr:hypothetical protein [Cereibacter sphaeroides]MCE6967136.1 hypothetical protein [Cereibacter sphaeroides]
MTSPSRCCTQTRTYVVADDPHTGLLLSAARCRVMGDPCWMCVESEWCLIWCHSQHDHPIVGMLIPAKVILMTAGLHLVIASCWRDTVASALAETPTTADLRVLTYIEITLSSGLAHHRLVAQALRDGVNLIYGPHLHLRMP